MDKDSKQVVVLLTHPNIKESRANKALMDDPSLRIIIKPLKRE